MNQAEKNKEIRSCLEHYGEYIENCVTEHAEEIKDLARRKKRIDDSAIVDPTAEIDPTAIIEANAKIYPYAKIGPRTIVREGAFVGTKSVVGSDCSLDRDTTVGEHCVLGNNVHTTERTTLGNRVKVGNHVVLSANNNLGNGVEIGNRVYFRAHVEIKAGATVGNDTVLERSAVVGAKAVIGAGSVLDDSAKVKTQAQIKNSFIADCASVEAEVVVDNSYINAGRTVRVNVKDGFAPKDGVMDIEPIINSTAKISAPTAKKLRGYYEKGAYGKFNEEFLSIIFPGKSGMIRDIRESLEAVVDDMRGGMACTRETLDNIDKDTEKSLKQVAQKGKFSSDKLIAGFATTGQDNLLPGLMKSICYNFSDIKNLLAELSEGNNYVFSAIDPENKQYKHGYYATEKALADDLLNSVNINLRAPQVPSAGKSKD